MARHTLFNALKRFQGNPRACVLTEPLWGIPFNLYIPFFAVYQYALGVHDQKIGLLLTVGLVCQMVAAFFSGMITDRIGRRRTTFWFDLVSWTLPVICWGLAQNFWWFFAATILNGFFYIPSVSWSCLLVEDARQEEILPIYTWITIAGLLAVFFAPLAGLLVESAGVVTAMRVLFALTLVMMTAKFVLLYRFSTETRQGELSRAASRQTRLRDMLREFGPIVRKMTGNRQILMVLGIMVSLQITGSITGSFFGLYATQNLGIPQPWLAWFPIVRAAVMLTFIFTIQNRLDRFDHRWPLLAGLLLFAGGQLLLVLSLHIAWFLAIYILFDALAFALVMPRKETLMAINLDARDRARMMSLLYVAVIGVSSPFGWIAGELSALDRRLPFLLNLLFYSLCVSLVLLTQKVRQTVARTENEAADISEIEPDLL